MRIRGTLEYPEPGYEDCRLVGRCPFAVPKYSDPQQLETIAPDHGAGCWRAIVGEMPDEGGITMLRIRYVNPVGNGALDAYFDEQLVDSTGRDVEIGTIRLEPVAA